MLYHLRTFFSDVGVYTRYSQGTEGGEGGKVGGWWLVVRLIDDDMHGREYAIYNIPEVAVAAAFSF